MQDREIDYDAIASYFDQRYVLRDDCNHRHEKSDEKINSIALEMARNTTQLGFISKIGVGILISTLCLLAEKILDLIFK